MAYIVPSFNIKCNIWDYTANVLTDPPRIANQDCQIRPGTQSTYSTSGDYPPNFPTMILLLPARTDIRPGFVSVGGFPHAGDSVECPAGTGRYYIVGQVDDIGRGFMNEHRFARMGVPVSPIWPTPVP